MGFTREEMEAYEKRPQTQVDDKVSPFRGATPAKAADAAALAAVAAGNIDATPTGGAAAAATSATVDDDAPVVDEDGTLGDPTESGEGTLDENADPSTAHVDPSDETDPNADLTGDQTREEDLIGRPAPKKGSAAERIVELNDKAEAYKLFGQAMQDQLKEANTELARIRAGGSAAPTTNTAQAPRVEELKDEPMPEMSDSDVNFDNDKYRAKIQKWTRTQARIAAREAVQEATGRSAAKSLEQEFDQKVEAFSKDHPDFENVVTKNPVLNNNQLHATAGLEVMRSPHAADILYAFGQDPAYALKVARMPLAQQLKEIGKVEDRIETKKKAASDTPTKKTAQGQQPAAQAGKGKSITQAPPPPRATQAAGRVEPRSVVDPNMSMEEFARRHHEERNAGRNQNRKNRGLS